MTRFVDYFNGIEVVRRYVNLCTIGGRRYYKVWDSVKGEEFQHLIYAGYDGKKALMCMLETGNCPCAIENYIKRGF